MSKECELYTKHVNNLRIILPTLLRRRNCLFKVKRGIDIVYRIDEYARIYAFEDNTLTYILNWNEWLPVLCSRIK
jgi:hypothetical protein